jgi:hypothetical protein
MAIVAKLSPVGVDLAISKIQTALYEGLVDNGTWTDYESYHRAYKNNSANGIKAEVHTCRDDYKDVFTDDQHGVSSFFIVSDDKTPLEANLFQTDIDIIFQIDLKKIYPNSPHRNDEEMHNEIASILTSMGGNFDLTNIITGIDNVYSEFDTGQLNYDDLQPFHVVRFTVRTKYKYVCAPVFAELFCNIGVVMSTTPVSTIGGTDGTATATPTGAQSGISYLWHDGQTTQTATSLSVGTYTVKVTDNILPPPDCVADGTIDVGYATMTVNNNGTLSIELSISGGNVDINFGNGDVLTGVGTGTHSNITPYTDASIKNTSITGDVQNITFISAINQDLLTVDIALFTSLTALQINNNSELTNINTGTSSAIWTTFLALDCNLTGNLDVSGLRLGGNFNIAGNPNLTGISNPTSSVVFTAYRADNCNLTGNLDVSGLMLGGLVVLYNNPNLTSITCPTSSQDVTHFAVNNCGLIGTLDVSTLSGLKITFYAHINSGLTGVNWPTNSNTFSLLYVYGCSLAGTDLSTLSGLWAGNNTIVRVDNNGMTEAEVDSTIASALAVSSGANGTGCTFYIGGSNSAPSAAGLIDIGLMTTVGGITCSVTT